MKFGRQVGIFLNISNRVEHADGILRYLAENLTSEWKRAYIDYGQCKKKIKVISARLGQNQGGKEEKDSSDGDADHGPSAAPRTRSSAVSKSPGRSSMNRENGRTGTPSLSRREVCVGLVIP